MKYDAIIAGASFAGLAVAKELKGNILLIDRKAEIGGEQKSTCCTFYHILEKLDCKKAILQITDTVILHIGSKDITYCLKHPFATFDYKKLCQILYEKSNVQFLQAKVYGVEDGTIVMTEKGNFQSECIVDATGWQAVLANSIKKDFIPCERKSFGLETTPLYKNKAIEIWVNPKMMPKGVAWIFPCNEFSRFGVGSYIGETNIKEELDAFLKKFDLKITKDLHGGFFPNKFREPTIENIFIVGDAAGQCMALSGEGIRQSFYFGEKCGKIIQKIIDKEETLEEGLKEYREFVMRRRKYYTFLSGLQKMFVAAPNFWMACFTKFINPKPIFKYIEKKYVNLANL
ncbi:MAG: NAD(P)/FAD-dependent oxidoreductase [Patescibacteria group bacterium]|nr:NAD(P)/FAD-dependent oxidoreductase [Patescibacteria group bacterium]